MTKQITKRIILPLFISIIFLMINCGGRALEIEGFDREQWVADRNGCQGFRSTQKQVILENKNDLLGNSSRQIIKLLGKPDRNELYRRNQKFYIYILEPGPDCAKTTNDKLPETLFIRFSATGLSKEIFIKRGSSPI